jgi:hypothetical protein
VQGELSTREYDRTIRVPNSKKYIEHLFQQLAVELKAHRTRILDRTCNSEQTDNAELKAEDESPPEGPSIIRAEQCYRCLSGNAGFRRNRTSGTGRIIPINNDELAEILMAHRHWFISRLGQPSSDHYVLPFGSPQPITPDRPVTDISFGWDPSERLRM